MKDKIIQFLLQNPELVTSVKKAIEIERSGGTGPPWKKGWNYKDVEAKTTGLKMLVEEGIITSRQEKSGKANTYTLGDIEAAEKAIQVLESEQVVPEEKTREIPDDLFDVIINHDPVKRTVRKGIKADDQVAFRLQGPSSTAKTLFLDELERLEGAYYRAMSGVTEAGFMQFLAENKPRYVLIDELDKANPDVYNPLYELTEHGRIQKTTHDNIYTLNVPAKIFATLNRPSKIPKELRMRMVKIVFPEYSDSEYIEVVVGVLEKRENLDKELAEHVAEMHLQQMDEKNVRDAIHIARMADNTKESVEKTVKDLKRYR